MKNYYTMRDMTKMPTLEYEAKLEEAEVKGYDKGYIKGKDDGYKEGYADGKDGKPPKP